jgi:siderophore synthetase component
MQYSSKEIAENASYQAFMNCYIREVGGTSWHDKEEWMRMHRHPHLLQGEHLLEVFLPSQGTTYAFEVIYRSIAGRHTLGALFKYNERVRGWEQEDRITLIIACIQELHLQAKQKGCSGLASHYDELILRMIDSYHSMTNYIEKRKKDMDSFYDTDSSFIQTEQSLMFGHWLHPTPKSRQGMAIWQHDLYAPELSGSFKLHYFEVDSRNVQEEGLAEQLPTQIISEMLKRQIPDWQQEEDKVYIPMHPLQAQWLIQQEYIKAELEKGIIKDLGLIGEEYTATSSLRTTYHPKEEWMFKFSIPVKVTNSLRINKTHELKAGLVMAKLFNQISFLKENPKFKILDDPGFLKFDLPERKETGLEVILRTNPFTEGKDKGIISVAALVQDPLPGKHSFLKEWIMRISSEVQDTAGNVSIKWFEHYWDCAVEPLFLLYDQYGVALEAHQQNSLLDLSEGYPKAYYFRDNQGYYLSRKHEPVLMNIIEDFQQTPELFYDEELIHQRFTYYLIINHLFSVVHRFGADGLIEEQKLLTWVYEKLEELENKLNSAGKKFVRYLLEEDKLACKANLLTRFHDVDELLAELEQAVYTSMPNPFLEVKKAMLKEKIYAAAYPS